MTYREAQKMLEKAGLDKGAYGREIITEIQKMIYTETTENGFRKWDDEMTEADILRLEKRYGYYKLNFRN